MAKNDVATARRQTKSPNIKTRRRALALIRSLKRRKTA
ncbi:putative metal homeostasis protein [Lacticaseibacillus yichunensis]|uniref:Metal homeostasis protein n=1 Tax=Lacticaseibacillus yichunensis TaxID=2486015 RepID=A0ABW4CT59_9LACO|nr:putative metal homeostasis protein [Lacticaseibacillus yichunensis]